MQRKVTGTARQIVVRRIHRRAAAIQTAAATMADSLKVETPAINSMRSLVLLGYDSDMASLWQHAWVATRLWAPGSPAHKGNILYTAALQGKTDVESVITPYTIGHIMQIHSGFEQVSAYLQTQQRRLRILFIDRNPKNEQERDSIRACRRFWQLAATMTLHASQIADDPAVFWDALETLGYPLTRAKFTWPALPAPSPALPAQS